MIYQTVPLFKLDLNSNFFGKTQNAHFLGPCKKNRIIDSICLGHTVHQILGRSVNRSWSCCHFSEPGFTENGQKVPKTVFPSQNSLKVLKSGHNPRVKLKSDTPDRMA